MLRNSLHFFSWILLSTSALHSSAESDGKNPLSHFDTSVSSLTQADTLFQATLYDKAIPLYKKFLQNLHAEKDATAAMASHARYQLAQAHLYNGEYFEVIELLEKCPENTTEDYFLLAIAYRKTGEFERAIPFLQRYILQSGASKNDAQLELGLNYFFLKKSEEATDAFTKLVDSDALQPLRNIAILYLAKLDLSANNIESAEYALKKLQKSLSNDTLLCYEWAYLLGKTYFQKEDYEQAVSFFSVSLPKTDSEDMPWYNETLYHLGWSYLKMAEKDHSLDQRIIHFDQAAQAFKSLLHGNIAEKAALALGQTYLTRARSLDDAESYQRAEELLANKNLFISLESKAQALLLRAEAAPTYALRNTLYRNLTQQELRETPFYAEGWFLRGLNDFEEGQSAQSSGKLDESSKAYEQAFNSFQKAFDLMSPIDKSRAAEAFKHQVACAHQLNTQESLIRALSLLDKFLKQEAEIQALSNSDEFYYLHAITASRLANHDSTQNYNEIAETSLRQSLKQYPSGSFADSSLILLGTLLLNQNKAAEAEKVFSTICQDYPESDLIGESWFWRARCAEILGEIEKSKEYKQIVFESHPDSIYAAEAYFSFYSFLDYTQGDRAAVKHLLGMQEKYSESPYIIPASYLIGLDYKRDRKTAEGKWIRKKNLTAAIDAFQAAEHHFDSLYQNHKLNPKDLNYFITIKYRAILERALTNLMIADESQAAKQQIYLKYSEELLQQLIEDISHPKEPLKEILIDSDLCLKICEEANHWLVQAYIKENNDVAAEKILTGMLEKYQSAKITKGYLLSRTWYEKAGLAIRRREYANAIQYLSLAEDSAKGRILSSDQKLDLWIQQSHCYQELKDWDHAILILSKVINDDSISSLRIKAMYLRAEAYELQGRHELARRQLEAASKNGGEWAQKAKQRLENNYGYSKHSNTTSNTPGSLASERF